MSKLTIELITKDPPGSETEIGLNERKPQESQYFLADKLLQVYLGPKSDLNLAKIRKRISDVDWKSVSETEVELNIGTLKPDEAEAAYEMIYLKSCIFDKYKTSAAERAVQVKKVTLRPKKPEGLDSELRDEIINAVKFCRDIVSSNANSITPGQMQEFAEDVASNSKQIKCKVIDSTHAKKLGMECLLAVGAESLNNATTEYHPRMVVLEFKGAKPVKADAKPKKEEHIVLVGKGITFDTGGLCLKPTQYMLDMKSDMTGSAIVLSVFRALSKLANRVGSHVKITGIMALAENAFGASSYKPGDVLRAMNGKTVEVIDTDAEGRLVLADALSYASTLNPDKIIDLATLTGSIVSTLGEIAAGAMGNSDELFKVVDKSFAKEGEKLWQMPLYEYYKDSLKSDIADIKHCNTKPDALCAGIFLREFVPESSQWLHLDIAGVGFLEKDGLWAYKGATGFGVKGLIKYLLSL